MQQFINDRCTVGDQLYVKQVTLHAAYDQWWREHIQEIGMEGPKKFGDVLCKSKGFKRDRVCVGSDRPSVYRGLEVTEQ